MAVTVAHPALAGRLAVSHRYWVYADDDQERHHDIAASIGNRASALVTPHAFQSRVAATRGGFVAWTDRCMQGLGPDAWLTSPLYKNPLDNPLFLHYCWLTEIRERLAAGNDDILVLTVSSGFAAAVNSLCRSLGIDSRTAGSLHLRIERGVRILRGILALVSQTCGLLWRVLLARWILGAPHRRKAQDTEIIVDVYLPEHALAADGHYTDRYLPGLVEYYSSAAVKSAVYPLLYKIPAMRVATVFRRMKASPIVFIPFELFANWSDVVEAARQSLEAAASRVQVAASGDLPFDLRPVVEWHQPVTAMRALVALVLLRAPARLAAAGIRPQWIIEWYENQPTDKASHIGFSAHLPDSRVIAVRQYPFVPDWLSLYTTTAEARAGAAPLENWVCGKVAANSMAAYDSVGAYRVVPALRYAHLYRESQPAPGTQLLLLLPYSPADARTMLRYVMPSLSSYSAMFERVVIKPHPAISRDTVYAYAARQWPDLNQAPLVWSDAPVAELLTNARIVVTTQSSAALEAVCCGKPVIIVGRTAGLAINVLEDVDCRLWRVVYDARELHEGVKDWTPEHPLPLAERLALGQALREQHFEPVNEVTMRAFLPWPEMRP